MVLAGVCIIVAAILLAIGKLDAAFVVAALGIVAWFLNYRVQLKAELDGYDRESMNEGEEPDED